MRYWEIKQKEKPEFTLEELTAELKKRLSEMMKKNR